MSAPRQKTALEEAEESSEEEGAPGPGYYYNHSAASEFNQDPYTGKMQYFGSTVERFPAHKSETIGPGKYSMNSDFHVTRERAELYNKKHKNIPIEERFKEVKPSQIPGPGAYKEKSIVEEINKKTWGKKGVFGTTAGRFTKKNQSGSPNVIPGPGAYKPEKSVAMLDSKKNLSIKRSSSMFLSKTVREPNKVKKNKDTSPPPGSYNLESNSIAQNIKKRIESGLGNPLLASLKAKIKLVAPFNSCSQRFESRTISENEQFLGPGYYEFKTFAQSKKPSTLNDKFLSSERRFNKGFGGKKIDAHSPGPGNYEKEREDPWNKKTFNITFAD